MQILKQKFSIICYITLQNGFITENSESERKLALRPRSILHFKDHRLNIILKFRNANLPANLIAKVFNEKNAPLYNAEILSLRNPAINKQL